MNTLELIADQVVRTYSGEAWHGDSIRQILKEITPEQAFRKPLSNIHSIWEIVLHITAWEQAVLKSLYGADYPMLQGADDWPVVKEADPKDWQATLKILAKTTERLKAAIVAFPEAKLYEQVPGQNFTFYTALHGMVQHNLYHAGQIAILKKL